MPSGLKRGYVDEAGVRLSKACVVVCLSHRAEPLLQKRPLLLELEDVDLSKEHPLASDDPLDMKRGSSGSVGSENDSTDIEDNAVVGETKTAQGQTESGKARKPPTGAEVRAIKAAQELFLSSSFKLQVLLRAFFFSRVSSLLGYHRLMPSYQTFDQRIHGSHHWKGSFFLFTLIFHLSRPLNHNILWWRRVHLPKVTSCLTTQERRKALVGMEQAHPRKPFLSLTHRPHRLKMPTGRFPSRNHRT